MDMKSESDSTSADTTFSSRNSFSCDDCNSTFTRKYNLKAHQRKFHNKCPLQLNQVCPLCWEKLRTIDDLHDHIEKLHKDVELCFGERIFYEESDFDKWKGQYEKETVSSYILSYTRVKNSIKVRQYRCHRSGAPKIKGVKRKRSKSTGTIKSGVICPAMIKVYNEDSTIVVKFQSTHLGHRCEVGKLPLPKEDRQNIASMLSAGMPINAIIDKTRTEFPPTKRVSLTTRQDIYNVVRDLNVNLKAVTVKKTMQDELNPVFPHYGITEKEIARESNVNEQRLTCQKMLERISGRLQTVDSMASLKYIEETLRNIEAHLDLMENPIMGGPESTIVAPPNKEIHQQRQTHPKSIAGSSHYKPN